MKYLSYSTYVNLTVNPLIFKALNFLKISCLPSYLLIERAAYSPNQINIPFIIIFNYDFHLKQMLFKVTADQNNKFSGQ